ncbi:MAG: hypothetical protein Q8P12_04625 [bacterium]|nr:hypothetical protein [bacterium]
MPFPNDPTRLTPDLLHDEFALVQQELILDSAINLDCEGQRAAIGDILLAAIGRCIESPLMPALLRIDEDPSDGLRRYVRGCIGQELHTRFGFHDLQV